VVPTVEVRRAQLHELCLTGGKLLGLHTVRKGGEERLSPVVLRRKGKNKGAALTGEENWSSGGTDKR
jgi:hypothetical protein